MVLSPNAVLVAPCATDTTTTTTTTTETPSSATTTTATPSKIPIPSTSGVVSLSSRKDGRKQRAREIEKEIKECVVQKQNRNYPLRESLSSHALKAETMLHITADVNAPSNISKEVAAEAVVLAEMKATEVNASVKISEICCTEYLNRAVKVRYPKQADWLNGTVDTIVQGSKKLRIKCEDGSEIECSVNALNGRGFYSSDRPMIKLIPLTKEEMMKANKAKEEKFKASEALRLEMEAKEALESHWREANKGKLSFLYLHAPPLRFQPAFLQPDNMHHLLAFLENTPWAVIEKQMSAATLAMIHGQPGCSLRESYEKAKEVVHAKRISTRGKGKWEKMISNLSGYSIIES